MQLFELSHFLFDLELLLDVIVHFLLVLLLVLDKLTIFFGNRVLGNFMLRFELIIALLLLVMGILESIVGIFNLA